MVKKCHSLKEGYHYIRIIKQDIHVRKCKCLRLDRGGECMIVSGGTRTGVSGSINKIYRHMIPTKLLIPRAFK